MPAKGARLNLRKRGGKSVWVILDTDDAGQRIEVSTRTDDSRQAEIMLADHIARKNRRSGPAEPGEMTVAEALSIYGEEHAPTVAAPERLGYAIQALLPFWGSLAVSAVKGATCRRYAATRTRIVRGAVQQIGAGTIRRELNCLGAALAYCSKEGYLLSAPMVTLPAKPETTQRALTRAEAGKLIRAARSRKQTHIARFILIGLYTGTRKDAILNLRLSGPSTAGGWFALDAGLLFRRGEGERVTKKRRGAARLPRQLLGHARRWHKMGMTWAVEWRGARVADIKTAWAKVAVDAKLGWLPTPHTLKHTAITWAMQGGATIADAAGFFSTSADTIERTYWHLSPDYQAGAVQALEGKTAMKSVKRGSTVGEVKQDV